MYYLNLWELLLCCTVAFIGGFATAIAGTGGLFTIPVYLLAGIPPFLVLGTNKAALVIGLPQAVRKFAKAGMVDWKIVSRYFLLGILIPATALFLVLQIGAGMWTVLISVVVVLGTVASFPGRKTVRQNSFQLPPWSRNLLLPLSWLYDGLAGPLSGALYFLSLNLTKGDKEELPEHTALGTSKVFQFLSVSSCTAVTFYFDLILWKLAFILGFCSALGNWAGAVWASRLNTVRLSWVLFFFCLLSASVLLGRIVYKQFAMIL